MAAGEYVSVSSQADTERADLARESRELAANPEQEQAELTAIYVKRGLDPALASTVAGHLMQHDALVHTRVMSWVSPMSWRLVPFRLRSLPPAHLQSAPFFRF